MRQSITSDVRHLTVVFSDALSPCQTQAALIIGKGGATIRQLQQESGAQIDIRKEDSIVRVRGSAAQIEEAQRRIKVLLGASSKPSAGAGAGAGAGAAPPGLSQARAAAADPPPRLA